MIWWTSEPPGCSRERSIRSVVGRNSWKNTTRDQRPYYTPSGRDRASIVNLLRKVWRRRPDLNRGWRFCRFPRVGYVVDPVLSENFGIFLRLLRGPVGCAGGLLLLGFGDSSKEEGGREYSD